MNCVTHVYFHMAPLLDWEATQSHLFNVGNPSAYTHRSKFTQPPLTWDQAQNMSSLVMATERIIIVIGAAGHLGIYTFPHTVTGYNTRSLI